MLQYSAWVKYFLGYVTSFNVIFLAFSCTRTQKLTHTWPLWFCCLLCTFQINLKSDVSTAVVTDLNPKTEYSLTVYAIYPGTIRGSATIIAQTSERHISHVLEYTEVLLCIWPTSFLRPASLPQVSNFRVIEEGLFSLRLGWTPPLGKLNGYKIFIPRCMMIQFLIIHFNLMYQAWLVCVCPTADRPGFIYEHLLPGDTSSHVIDSLQQHKMYTIGIYAVYPQGPSEPVSIKGKTRECISQHAIVASNRQAAHESFKILCSCQIIAVPKLITQGRKFQV